jgi:choline dehydrogenase
MRRDFEADIVIVGAGSAGCLLANRLSADPSLQVLLIEAGGVDSNPWIHVPLGYAKTIANPSVNWCYKTEPAESLAVASRMIALTQNGIRCSWPERSCAS